MPFKHIMQLPAVEVPAPHRRDLRTMYSSDEDGQMVGDLTVFHLTVFPHSCSDHHSHDLSGEIMYVMTGFGEGILGEERFSLEPETAFYAPPGVPHQVINKTDELMKLVCIFSPGVGTSYARAKAQLHG